MSTYQTKRRAPNSKYTKCKDFDISKFSATKLDLKSKYAKKQYIGYTRYGSDGKNSNSPLIELPSIKLDQGGIPQLEWTQNHTDKERSYIQVPLNPEDPNAQKLRNVYKQIDDYMCSDEAKNIIFEPLGNATVTTLVKKGKKKVKKQVEKPFSSLYEYTSIIRKSGGNIEIYDDEDDEYDEDEDDIEEDQIVDDSNVGDQDKKQYHDRCKIRVPLDWETDTISVPIFIKRPGCKVEKLRPAPKNMTELQEHLKFRDSIKGVVRVAKVWASKSKDKKTKKYSYGITLKFVQLVIIPSERASSNKEVFEEFVMTDSEDEYDNDKPTNTVAEKADNAEDEEDVGEEAGEDEELDDDELEDDDEEDEDEDENEGEDDDENEDEDDDDNSEIEDEENDDSEEFEEI